MRWRARAAPSRAKERANISFFIFIMFFAVFGVIILTELLLLERPNAPGSTRSRYNDEMQVGADVGSPRRAATLLWWRGLRVLMTSKAMPDRVSHTGQARSEGPDEEQHKEGLSV
ncbi:unnamed protein product, partial [Iphiclides podalirius]